jgi:hypothetical protein
MFDDLFENSLPSNINQQTLYAKGIKNVTSNFTINTGMIPTSRRKMDKMEPLDAKNFGSSPEIFKDQQKYLERQSRLKAQKISERVLQKPPMGVYENQKKINSLSLNMGNQQMSKNQNRQARPVKKNLKNNFQDLTIETNNLRKEFKNHIRELGGNDISFLKTTYVEKNLSNSVKSGELLELIAQIFNRLSHIEHNIECIKSAMTEMCYQSPNEVERNNIFASRKRNMGYPIQVATPNFAMRNEINFEEQNIKEYEEKLKENMKNEQQVEEVSEVKKKSAQGFHDSFNSFQEKTELSEQSEAKELNGNNGRKKELNNDTSESSMKDKINSNSATPTLSDVILSDKNVKIVSENNTINGSIKEKKDSSEEKYQEKKNNNSEPNKPKTKKKFKYHKNYNSRRYNNRRYYNGGYNRYKDNDHYYF